MSNTVVAYITVVAEDETASDEAAVKLLHELRDVDGVVGLDQATEQGAPPGAHSGELIAIGTLVLTVVAQTEIVAGLIGHLIDWRRRQGRGRVELRTPKFELIVPKATDAQIDKIIEMIVEEGRDPDS